jgi:hypothetical protein
LLAIQLCLLLQSSQREGKPWHELWAERSSCLAPTSISAQRLGKQKEVWHSAEGLLEGKRRKHFSIISITPSPQGTLWVSL